MISFCDRATERGPTGRWAVACGWLLLAISGAASAAAPLPITLRMNLNGQLVEGVPLAWSAAEVRLLGRDGRLWQFRPEEAREVRKTADSFVPLSVSEFRAQLLRELGQSFEVSAAGHYMVAHPRGQRDRWAERFEEHYRTFVRFFKVRGFAVTEPPFPLVVIACRDQAEFRRLAAGQGAPAPRGVLGFYALDSNRILLFDAGGGHGSGRDWRQNARVAIHEATHQAAFNTGLHSRHAPPPLWVAEGLATLFEAPGIADPQRNLGPADRVNRERLDCFRTQLLPRHRPKFLADIVASDQLFRALPAMAYAESWALTHYLLETQPRKYTDFLTRAARTTAANQDEATRLREFQAVFGADWNMLDAQFRRFYEAADYAKR